MEFSSFAPRAEPAALAAANTQPQPPSTLSTAAETARPVLAAAKVDPTEPRSQDAFQPLDTFEVGDNDHVPVPPEPPRKEAVLALIANAPEVEAPAEPPEKVETLTENLRAIDAGPDNPTVDIRS